jgi:hypothetical protein
VAAGACPLVFLRWTGARNVYFDPARIPKAPPSAHACLEAAVTHSALFDDVTEAEVGAECGDPRTRKADSRDRFQGRVLMYASVSCWRQCERQQERKLTPAVDPEKTSDHERAGIRGRASAHHIERIVRFESKPQHAQPNDSRAHDDRRMPRRPRSAAQMAED